MKHNSIYSVFSLKKLLILNEEGIIGKFHWALLVQAKQKCTRADWPEPLQTNFPIPIRFQACLNCELISYIVKIYLLDKSKIANCYYRNLRMLQIKEAEGRPGCGVLKNKKSNCTIMQAKYCIIKNQSKTQETYSWILLECLEKKMLSCFRSLFGWKRKMKIFRYR